MRKPGLTRSPSQPSPAVCRSIPRRAPCSLKPRNFTLILAAFCAISTQIRAQNPSPDTTAAAPQKSSTNPAASDSVIRIDVNLVQVDAVVTDAHGRRVTDLPASAFEITQDGKPQSIANFTYVASNSPASGSTKASNNSQDHTKPAKNEISAPTPELRPEEVRRTLAIIVDDLGLSGESMPPVKSAIKNFIDNQMRPGDLVAVIRVGAGMGSLQQFTSDKRLLYKALDRLKYDTQSRVGVSSFAPLGRMVRGEAAMNRVREDGLAVGSLGAIQFVVNGMRGFPGRKSVILFTENVRMLSRGTVDVMTEPAVRALADAANRAAVVIHAIDPRGIADYNITPADDTARMSGRRRRAVPQQREEETIQTEQGMFVLAGETGGLFLHDTNDLAGALKKAAEDGDGYYLIGYHPDAETFEKANGEAKFHRIRVSVKGAGLQVRSRDGFFGEAGADSPGNHTREAELVHGLQSPLSLGSIHPRLTAIFSNQPEAGSFIDALLYFDAKEFKWSTEADGMHKALVDLSAAAFDENGAPLAPVDTTLTFNLPQAKYEAVLARGMVYGIHVPIKKPGPYMVRAALRDPATDSTGSAQQFVDVADVESGHLAVSGMVFEEAGAAIGPPPGIGASENLRGRAARRVFRRNTYVMYGYDVINAKAGSGGKPDLEVETRLFHENEKIFDDKAPLAASAASRQVRAAGRLALGSDLKPGEYVLQVIVTDKLAKGKASVAVQSADFEIEN